MLLRLFPLSGLIKLLAAPRKRGRKLGVLSPPPRFRPPKRGEEPPRGRGRDPRATGGGTSEVNQRRSRHQPSCGSCSRSGSRRHRRRRSMPSCPPKSSPNGSPTIQPRRSPSAIRTRAGTALDPTPNSSATEMTCACQWRCVATGKTTAPMARTKLGAKSNAIKRTCSHVSNSKCTCYSINLF